MQPHKPMERIAERPWCIVGAWALALCAVYGCTRAPSPGEDDSQPLPDVPADLPSETIEYEGILYGLGFGIPTQFWQCESTEVFEMAYLGSEDYVWEGSCSGVYNRVQGRVDRSFEPPRLIIEETLEARWSEPSDCIFLHEPDYKSCHIEEHPDSDVFYTCYPVDEDCNASKCIPERFDATEVAGWKHHNCREQLGEVPVGEACEYVNADLDDCDDNLRCWNATGDLSAPGVCVPYCDLTGQFGEPCDGTCVRCGTSDEWGLCMTDCSGEDCNVDAFC